MMNKLIIIFALTLQGCVGLDAVNETVKTGADAIATVKKADGIQSVGKAADKLAEAQVKKQETKQLKIKADANALQVAITVLNQVEGADKINLAKGLLKSREARIAGEQETTRTQFRTNALFWGMVGLLIGFVLSIILKALSNASNRLEGNVKFLPKSG